jgi:rod shape-determining protein MreD
MAGSQPTHTSNRILLPAKSWFIAMTQLIALLLNMIPFGRLPGIPDWVALVLAFWCVHQPQRVGMTTAFVLGMAMDVANGSVMGQHSLAYVLLAFAASGLSRRILWFPLSQQALHVLPMFLGMQLVMLVARMMAGAEFPGVLWFLSSFTAVLLWYPATFVLLAPQFMPVDTDTERPI